MDLTPAIRLGLLLIRPSMLFMVAPVFGGSFAPAPVKIGLSVLTAVALAPIVTVPATGNVVSLGVVVAHELAVGLALAMAIRAFVAAAELGGVLTGFQIGLSYSAIIDPQSGVRNNLVSTLYSNVALVTFFMLNGHHAFLRALFSSYAAMPLGMGGISASMPQTIIHMLGLIFTLGVRLAAPVVSVLLATELGLALVGRAAPALNLLAMGPSIRAMVGMLVLTLAAPSIVSALAGATDTTVQLGIEAAKVFR